MNINLDCANVKITPYGNRNISLEIEDVSESEILNNFSEQEIVKHFDFSKLLEEIGVENAKDYWDLKDND